MYFDARLWGLTSGLRWRIAFSVVVGLLAAVLGVARLALLGWLIAQVFEGRALGELVGSTVAVAVVILARGGLEYLRTMVAHRTAALVQTRLREQLYVRAVALGPAWFGLERTADAMISMVDGVEQLETYFGQFLPQIVIAAVTPVVVFCFVAFLDVPVALVLLVAALVTLFAPMLSHRLDRAASMERSRSFREFAAEFLDAVQGLTTLKAFGQASARADELAIRAHELSDGTMRVNMTNAMGRGITDAGIAIGAAVALVLCAYRVADGSMPISTLLVVLLMGVELFRPLRDLRAQLHTGMLGQAAAQAIFKVLDAEPFVTDAALHCAKGESSVGPEQAGDPSVTPSISFEAVSFAYPGTSEPIHAGLDFDVVPGARIGIVGASGSGKSTLVRLLLRFYDPDSGMISIDGRDLRDFSLARLRSMFAVVNQDTYLFHGSVEDNLRLGKPDATQQELVRAATAASAHGFITDLPQGYATIVGERGIRLSGGQRQRIAIARALLRDAPILVLDEALSAVDAENEALIQTALDRLMVGRTTLIFAHRLSSIIGADEILVLEEGRIAERGSHAELMAADGAYRRLMGEQADERSTSANARVGEEMVEQVAADRRELVGQMADLEPTDAILRAEGLGWWGAARALLGFVTVERAKLLFAFVFGVLRVAALIGVGALSALIVRAVKDGDTFDTLVIWLAIAAPMAGILHWLESWFAHDMAFKLLATMRVQLFSKLEKLAPAYLLRRRTGDLAAMATQDVETVEYFYAHTIAPAFVALLVPTAVLITLQSFGAPMALALLPFLAVVVLSPFLMRKRLDRLGSKSREALGELNAFAVDTIQGLPEIIAFEHTEIRRGQLRELMARVRALRLGFYRDLTGQTVLLEVATGLGGLSIILTGAWLVISGSLDSGVLPLLTMLAMAAFLPVSEIAHIGRQLADTLGATRRLYAVEREPIVVVDGPGVSDELFARGISIRMQNVTYTYQGRVEPALNQVDLDIPEGSTLALVGSSGAGKTTLAHLLVRFWDPSDGQITMNGRDAVDFGLDQLRRHVALVAQDTYLFNRSLRENILMARPDATPMMLAQAVQRASLDEVIGGLPMGLDTPVGERGMRLSGGQRQRVAIARAFLKDAPVLILDEATSHLDAVNERAVRRALDELMQHRTTVVIAHRLSTVRDADQIAVMDGGRIVEIGNHDSLLDEKGMYARLVARQMVTAEQAAAG